MKFNLKNNMKSLDLDITSYMMLESLIPKRKKMISSFFEQDFWEECLLNSLFVEDLDQEQQKATEDVVETILIPNDEAEANQDSKEVVIKEEKKSLNGLTLKELPKHLKYVFFGDEDTKLIIIGSGLTVEEKEKLQTH